MDNYWKNIVEKAQKKSKNGEKVPFFSLAPMEAVTDTVFRRVVDSAAKPDVYFTEFINARSIAHPKAKFSVQGRLFYVEQEEIPVAQLWGNRAEDFTSSIPVLKEKGYQAIDINMGCPDATVIKNHGGSDLIRHFDDAQAIILAAKEQGLPVSVKTRLGFNHIEEMYEWIPFLLRQDVEVLTIHLRTRKEMSKVDAHFEVIDELLQMRDEIAPNTLIQINGDIKNREQGLELVKKHPGIDGIMIGRGIFESPYAFADKEDDKSHDLDIMFDLLRYQLDLHDDYTKRFGVKRFVQLKRFFKIYVRNIPHATDIREKLVNSKSTQEVREILDEAQAAYHKWLAEKPDNLKQVKE